MKRSLFTFTWLAILLLAPPIASAAEESNYVFNPTLSLTGDCSTSTADPIPDPGCPGGAHPPAGAFAAAAKTALDEYGNRYVINRGIDFSGSAGRIDIFTPGGAFISEIKFGGASSAAVDKDGNLYVVRYSSAEFEKNGLWRFSPTVWKPESGEIEYEPPVRFFQGFAVVHDNIEVNRLDGHVYMKAPAGPVWEFGSAAEENKFIRNIGEGKLDGPALSLALDTSRARIYVPSGTLAEKDVVVDVFELGGSHELIGTIDGSTTPEGEFVSTELTVAVNEENGHVFVGELSGAKKRIYEFEPDGSYVGTIEKTPVFQKLTDGAHIGFDNGTFSPNRGDLFVPSGQSPPSHAFVFEAKPISKPPLVGDIAAVGITRTGTVLTAKINPEGQPTTYRLEYTSEQSFEEEEFNGATLAREGSLPAALEDLSASAAVDGLVPGTEYRFRAVAENEAGQIERQAAFTTYPALAVPSSCPNEALRTGPSAALPDCRAYELVTPSNTNGHAPQGVGNTGRSFFATREASPDGGALSFRLAGGPIPGLGGTGFLYGDPYLSTRTATGWTTAAAGPDGVEAPEIEPGSSSLDQGYSFWHSTERAGSLVSGQHVRYPDGHSELVGRGSLGSDPSAEGLFIAPGGKHVIFSSTAQLEPEAPAAGSRALYDRTLDEITHVVSLLPGEVTPSEDEHAWYSGTSADGRAVAFRVNPGIDSHISTPLYLRLDNAKTYEAAPPGSTFEGLDEDGSRLFYLQGGDLYAFDVASEQPLRFTESGDATVVNVSAGGEVAYFVSPSVLTAQPNPRGDAPQPGGENLYRSREGQIGFVGTVTEEDLDSLGSWAQALVFRQPANDPSRSTADGEALLLESRADLAGYDSEGHPQVYRYDAGANTLRCISCPPTRTPATGEANLQSVAGDVESVEPLSRFGIVDSLSADGRRAFFESTEALVLEDTDGLRDVYEWEEEGVGSCHTAGGCVYLISSSASGQIDYLYATTPSGDDVFFRSSDLLLPQDQDETASIYDARVGGGFVPPDAGAGECLGEACQPTAVAPSSHSLSSAAFQGSGNVNEKTPSRRACPKGKRKVRHGGKAKCAPVQKKHRRHKHKPATTKGRAHR